MEQGRRLQTIPRPAPHHDQAAALYEIQAMRSELAALRRLFDDFAGVFLNAKFPYGRPTDRWARR